MDGHAQRAHDAPWPRLRADAVPLWAWWGLAIAVIAFRTWLNAGRSLAEDLGDMDDAARLVQVRELLAGASWFDTTTLAMGGKAGMLSHWSRLIDLPIAGLISGFGLFMPQASAEIAARAVWPLFVLAPFVWMVMRVTEHVSGMRAGKLVLALVVLSPLGLYQFDMGRIDHHNVMIAASVSAILLMWAYPASIMAWRTAGVLAGLALAVGYEALAPVAALSVLGALWSLADTRVAASMRAYTVALMASFALAFFATIPPARWFDVRCDAISLNLVALIALGGGGLVSVLGPGRSWNWPWRLGVLGLASGVGVAVFGALEPKCLAGPMGQIPSELKAVWLDQVPETFSIVVDLANGKIAQAGGAIAYFSIGLAAAVTLARQTGALRDVFLASAVVVLVGLACWQYKYLPYASFLVAVPLAMAIARLGARGGLGGETVRFAAVLGASQMILISASTLAQSAVTVRGQTTVVGDVLPNDCLKSSAIGDLTVLPPGLIATRIDLGAHIAALTRHHVLSAPYHRIAAAIIANDRLFAAKSADDAKAILDRESIDYVVTCRGMEDAFVGTPEWAGTLRAGLVAGRVPSFLKPVALSNPATLFKAWRVQH